MPATLQANAFVSLEQAKAFLLIKGTDRDDLLTDAINRISDYCENYCQRGFKRRTLTNLRVKAQWTPKLYLPIEPIDVTEPIDVSLDGSILSVWRSEDDGEPGDYDVMVGSDAGEPNFLIRAEGWMGSTPLPIRLSLTAGWDPIRGDVLDAYYTILDFAWREQLTKTQDIQQLSGAAPAGSFTLRESLIPLRAKYTLDMYRAAGRVGGSGGFDAGAMRGAGSSPRPPTPPTPGGAPVGAPYVTLAPDPTLTDERILTAGANISLTDNGPGNTVVIAATGGAAGGAPITAQYVTLAADPTLTDERVLTSGANISLADSGPGGAIVISATIPAPPAAAPVDASYLTGAANPTLTAERVVTSTPTVAWDLTTPGQARADVPNDSISFSKLQNVNAARVLGRGSTSSGDPEELTVGTGLSLTGTTLSATPTPPPPAAPPDAQYVTLAGDPTLTNERILTAGANITFNDAGPGGALTISAAAGGGGGAPTTASFVTVTAEAGLTNERVLTAGANVTIDDGGPGGAITISAAGGGSGGAPVGAQYLVGATDPTLTAERVVTNTPTVTWDLATAGQALANVPNDAITFARMQNIATDRLLGRDTAGAGDPEELTAGGGIEFTGAGGIQRSALTGDVTAPAGSNATTIPADSITFAKLQNLTASRVLGRGSASAGDPEELTVGSGLNLTGTVLSATAPPAAAPVGAEYLVGATDATLTAERVVTGTPTVAWDLTTAGQARASVPDDAITFAKLQNVSASRLIGRGAAGGPGDPEELTIGSGLSLTGTTLSAPAPPAGAPVGAQYVTLAADPTLTNERVLTAGANVTLTDGGPGGALTIAATGGGGGPTDLRVLKVTADVIVNNSIVLVPVTGLELPVAPGEKWFVEYDIQANSALAPDHRWGFSNPPNTTIYWGQFATIAGAFHFNTPAGTAHIAPIMQDGFLANEGNAATDCLFHFRAWVHVGDTGGTVVFTFAQNTATATPTIVRAGSSGLARRVL